jgi:hypothetical protein
MNILFCDNPFDKNIVDPDYDEEFNSAKENGFRTQLFSFESLVKDNNAQYAIRKVKESKVLESVIYRGWMLRPSQYVLLFNALLTKNLKLINLPVEYQNCHYMPDGYRFISDYSPKTIWMPAENGEVEYEKIFEAIKVFHDSHLIIKDYVKSQKHYWNTACFISSAADNEKVKSVISRFIELQGPDLNEGIVVREFVELNDLTIHTKSGMPLKQEYRLFFLYGHLIGCYNYWEEGDYYENEQPPLEFFKTIAKGIQSNFFTMDIAKTKKDRWIIIELGDGQVAGLPEKANKNQFYQSIRNSLNK